MIKLSGFNARAQQDVSQAIKALTKQGASEFSLDVRDNRGGLYQEGAEVAKLFLEGTAGLLVRQYGMFTLIFCNVEELLPTQCFLSLFHLTPASILIAAHTFAANLLL